MLKITDTMIAEARRQDLLNKMDQEHLKDELRAAAYAAARTATGGSARRRPLLARVGSRMVKWGAYLEAHYGEPESQVPIKLRA